MDTLAISDEGNIDIRIETQNFYFECKQNSSSLWVKCVSGRISGKTENDSFNVACMNK